MLPRDRQRPSCRRILATARVPYLLVTDPVNIRYLTGIDASVGFLLLSQFRAELFLDGRYIESAKTACRRGILVRPVEEFVPALRALRKVGIESHAITLERFRLWKRKFKNTKFIQTTRIIEEFRRIKRPDELAAIRGALRITHAILRRVPSMLKSGLSERNIALEIESLAIRAGADGMAFDTIVAFGENSSSPHHHPGSRCLRRGDLVQIDMGVRLRGYCSDVSRVFFTAAPTPEQRRVFRALQRAKRVAEHALVPGVTNRALDHLARRELRSAGLEEAFTHALGHGLGLAIHEQPSLSRKAPRAALLRGEVVTIEPGAYFPGVFGMRLEDTHVVR